MVFGGWLCLLAPLAGFLAILLAGTRITRVQAGVLSTVTVADVSLGGPSSDVTAPTISGVSVTPNGTSATISWTTNEFATALVEYGTAMGTLNRAVAEVGTSLSHSVTLTGLSASTTYFYRISSSDAFDNPAANAITSFNSGSGGGDITPPVISNVVATPTSTGATITRERQNAGDTRSKGLELDAEVRPGAGARIRASLAVTSATFLDSLEPVLIGNDLPQVPGAAFSLWVDVPMPRSLVASAVLRTVSTQFDDDRNTFELASATQLDLRLSGRIADLTVLAPPADTLDPDETVYSSSAGDLTLLLDLTDAATGNQLLRAGGRHSISIDPVVGGGEDDPVINSAAVSELFDQQALILHQRIEQLRKTPAPPAP